MIIIYDFNCTFTEIRTEGEKRGERTPQRRKEREEGNTIAQ